MLKIRLLPLFAGLVLFGSAFSASAQWLTQSFDLKQGWNAVYLHVDVSHDTLHNLVGAGGSETEIREIWLWSPRHSTRQFVVSPQQPLAESSEWQFWKEAESATSALQRLGGNVACLVYAKSDYVWRLKGRPVPPRHLWSVSGLNFVGFPTDPTNPPKFDNFLSHAAHLQNSAEIYHYPGGELGAGNPTKLITHLTTSVRRGHAYWIHSENVFNNHYGPFEVSSASEGVVFGDHASVSTVRLRNLTAAAVTVTLNLIASESPPGNSSVPDLPALLIRGPLNTTNLSYGYTRLEVGAPISWTLAAANEVGSEAEIVIGLNRSANTNRTAGELLAGILRLTDSLGQTQQDLPVSAEVADTSGLWVGGSAVTHVGQYLKTYQSDDEGNLVLSNFSSNGAPYLATGTNTAMTAVPRPFPLRLIVHNSVPNGQTTLLQRVFVGPGATGTNVVVTTQQAGLDQTNLGAARRITAPHLPFSHANAGWQRSGGTFEHGSSLSFSVALDYNDHASNPFLHTFHPDHDNLKDSDFRTVVAQGVESYGVTRAITLQMTPPADDFGSLTSGGVSMVGDYSETLTFSGRSGNSRQFHLAGKFTLNRISSEPVLVTTP